MLALDAVVLQDTPVAVHGTAPVAEVPFTLVNDYVMLHTRVDGVPADLVLDTGSGVSVLDSAWAARNGVARSGRRARCWAPGRHRLP